MHPAQRAAALITGDAALNKIGRKVMRSKLSGAKAAREKAALVLVPLEVDYKHTVKSRFRELH
jgi:hypothetical protein